MFHSHILIEDKAHLLHDMKDELKKTSEHFNKASELKDIGKREAEMQYKREYNRSVQGHEQAMKNMQEQYEHLMGNKESEL